MAICIFIDDLLLLSIFMNFFVVKISLGYTFSIFMDTLLLCSIFNQPLLSIYSKEWWCWKMVLVSLSRLRGSTLCRDAESFGIFFVWHYLSVLWIKSIFNVRKCGSEKDGWEVQYSSHNYCTRVQIIQVSLRGNLSLGFCTAQHDLHMWSLS